MPMMRFLKKNFPYNGHRMIVGQEAEVESRFVPLLRRFKIAELMENPSVQPKPPPPKQPEIAIETNALNLDQMKVSMESENQPDVSVEAVAETSADESEEKDIARYDTKDMAADQPENGTVTGARRRYTRKTFRE